METFSPPSGKIEKQIYHCNQDYVLQDYQVGLIILFYKKIT